MLSAVLNFGTNIALTRMLTEADFGLLAMIAIFVAVASDLANCGMVDGLIHKLKPTATDYGTMFLSISSMGLFFGLLFFFGAPLFAAFFEQPALADIMRVCGICFFFQCMYGTIEAYMRKHLRMKAICIARISAVATADAIGIILAAKGYGYWALVATQMLVSVILFFYFLVAARWFPKLQFSVKSFRELFNYGIHLMLAYLGTLVSKNINTSVLGKAFSPSVSGVYYQGAKLAAVPFGVTETSLNMPFFAVASNEPDDERRRALIVEMMPRIVGINAFIMMYLMVIGHPVIGLMYGSVWLAAVPILRILAVYEFMATTKFFCQTICKIYDSTRLIRNLAFGEIVLQLALLAAMFRYGILWVAWSQALAVSMMLVLYFVVCARRTGLRVSVFYRMMWEALWLPALAALVTLAVHYGIGSLWQLNNFMSCVVVTLAYGLTTICVGEIFHPRVYMSWRNRLIRRRA
ncbi:MAG: oligosaccharide flippase family protein [Muribaculaceae bacterium]|nr:oligosaccharide flippase family protein [Muribaculaceae bacterium]